MREDHVLVTRHTLDSLIARSQRIQRRNKDISTREAQLTKSRDSWKKRALKYQREKKAIRQQLRRCRDKLAGRPTVQTQRLTRREIDMILAIPPRT